MSFIFKNPLKIFLGLIALVLIYIVLYKLYIPRISAFGCFDDCFNIVAGYFMTEGKVLYQDIPFNHQRIMADLSFFIQSVSNPINIFELILRHRQFLFLFSFLMNFIIFLRFGFVVLGFTIFFEFSKFYIFGDRFLAESFIVYPLVYLTCLLWKKLNKEKIYALDYILSALFTWFIIFAREPFVPVSLVFLVLIFWHKPFKKAQGFSLLLFLLLTVGTLLLTPLKDYVYDVFYVNSNRIQGEEVNLLISFLYPFYLFLDGEWNLFRSFILGTNIVFIVLSGFMILKGKLKLISIFILVLGLLNIRYAFPGEVFYSTFHTIPWYGIFLITLFLMLKETFKTKKSLAASLSLVLISVFVNILFSPQSFVRERIKPHEEFLTNYGNYLHSGETVRLLSDSSDTFFVDGFDELIHWQAKRQSPYKYTWYTSFMPNFPKFSQEREKMFTSNPPDFYYGSCPKEKNTSRLLPKGVEDSYVRLLSQGDPTCLFVRKDKIGEISNDQWEKAKEFLYDKPFIN